VPRPKAKAKAKQKKREPKAKQDGTGHGKEDGFNGVAWGGAKREDAMNEWMNEM
jgi:hypothetical protein